MTAIMKLRHLMLTLFAALALGLGGMAHAGVGGDAGSGDGATGQDAPETLQWEDDEDDEWEDDDDDWEDDDDDW